MKIINKYILKQLIVSFALVLVGLVTLIWLTQSLRMIEMIVTKGVSFRVFMEMTMLVLPNFVQIGVIKNARLLVHEKLLV